MNPFSPDAYTSSGNTKTKITKAINDLHFILNEPFNEERQEDKWLISSRQPKKK